MCVALQQDVPAGQRRLVFDIETVPVSGVYQSAASGIAGTQQCVRLLPGAGCRIVCVRRIPRLPAGPCRIIFIMSAAVFPVGQRQYAVVRQYRKFQNHLIHLCVTVSPDAEYLRLHFIEHGDDFLRCVAFRQVVPGAVIEYVAQKQQPACTLSVKTVQQPAAVMRRAVYIRCYHYFHILSLPPADVCRRYVHSCAAGYIDCPPYLPGTQVLISSNFPHPAGC